MTPQEFLTTLGRRADHSGIQVSQDLAARLSTYFGRLAFWNQKMSLTGFSLDDPTDAAIDRLLIEPLVAAKALRRPVRAVVDIGSGGGSPAIPMLLALEPEKGVLVESRSRKCTFLRECLRELGLAERVAVLEERFERLADTAHYSGQFDLLTVRAVRLDSAVLLNLASFLAPNGQLILFGTTDEIVNVQPGLKVVEVLSLHTDGRSTATFLVKV